MSLIDVRNLSFSYEGSAETVFENVSFQLDTNWRLGLVGRNGRGKTTLLRLLQGALPCGGQIHADVEFEYFPYAVEDAEAFTVEVIRAAAPGAEDWQIARECSLLDLPEELLWQTFESLSFGERTKALLAALFLRDNTFLLIDEPTNHLDAAGRQKLADYLRRKRGFLMVSHDRAFLDGCIDHVLALDRAQITIQRGNFSAWWQEKLQQDQAQLERNEHLKKDAARLRAAAQRAAAWSGRTEKGKFGANGRDGAAVDRGFVGHRSAKMMQRAKSIQRRRDAALAEKEGLLSNVERTEGLSLWSAEYHSPCLAELREVSVSYGGRTICEPVSFVLKQGERIALQGVNGCGKSSLLRLLMGQAVPHSGTVVLSSGVRVSYVGQETDVPVGTLADYARAQGVEEHRFKAILRKMGFSRAQLERDASCFSTGERRKVLLAASLCQQAHLYLWDEPLNYIDVFSRIQIEELLLEAAPSLLFVEHDTAFVNRVATGVLLVRR